MSKIRVAIAGWELRVSLIQGIHYYARTMPTDQRNGRLAHPELGGTNPVTSRSCGDRH